MNELINVQSSSSDGGVIPSLGDVFETTDGYSTDDNVESADDDMDVLDSDNNGDNEDDDAEMNHLMEQNNSDCRYRDGTISSARFNILSTMVGGGCLSLPLAFQKSGNCFIGPILLFITASITEFIFRIHIHSARISNSTTRTNNNNMLASGRTAMPTGNDSFEKIAATAFGTKAYVFCTVLVSLMCFFGTVGYAVLLRDMLRPINDAFVHLMIHHHTDSDNSHSGTNGGVTWYDNISMWIIVLLITPACTLQSLTSLRRFGAFSMGSILILGCCIIFRSGECMVINKHHFWNNFQFFPNNWHDVLDVIPLYISCYVCHYNLLPVHNELQNPTKKRVKYWLQSTVWVSTFFYFCIGLAGSAYGQCSANAKNGTSTTKTTVHGNILLDFPEDDPLLLIGRMCLAITITLAFPMLTIPARDILIRAIPSMQQWIQQQKWLGMGAAATPAIANASLTDALLEDFHNNDNNDTTTVEQSSPPQQHQDPFSHAARALQSANIVADPINSTTVSPTVTSSSSSFMMRLTTAIIMFWTAAAVASCVSSIDIVWDLLGSSLSILLSYLIPSASYILIVQQRLSSTTRTTASRRQYASISIAIALLLFFTPLMFISTANAIYNTFFKK